MYPKLKLSKKGAYLFLKGGLWIPRDCILEFSKAKAELEPGSLVKILSPESHFLGIGYFNPEVYYCLKVLTTEDVLIDKKFFVERFKRCLELRKEFYKERVFRLVFAEGDYLPGLIVDVFESVVVIQSHTKGIENLLRVIIEAIEEVLNPNAVVLKNDHSKRSEEGLESYVRVVKGEVKDPLCIEIDEIKFLIPILSGQKTGFFLDQRENRRFVARFSKDKVVIDAFCYTGGFGFYALKAGAKRVFFLDRSSFALELVEEGLKLNRFSGGIVVEGDVFNNLRQFTRSDLVVVDPPAFIKTKKAFKEGIKKYKRLYQIATSVVEKGCVLGCSCSSFLSLETLKDIVSTSALSQGKNVSVIYQFKHPLDHPINPWVPETEYLKAVMVYLF